MKKEKLYITGLHGCKCHPFESWTHSDICHRQKLAIGTKVKLRCNTFSKKKEGIINEVLKKPHHHYFIVKFGPLKRDLELRHSAELETI